MPTDPKLVRDHFLAAAELPAAERGAYLHAHCGDAGLRTAVERLLAAHDQPASVLNQPVPGGPDQTGAYVPRELPGLVIAGRYKLLEAIGEGGMGTVWVAEQTQPVRRKVALKLIKAGMDSKSVLARFETERQALAVMDHPNIAKVLDGGLTETGRPFFVMEYIKGVPITEYCDATRLSVPERLNLFVQVCHAVQHAHHKGIIHRDLKPSNILVAPYDDKPVPKVIDFGLAKAMHQSLTERTLHTAHETVLGTPLYMSPEQAQLNNLDVDTRSDIYALGVLLYELLTGTTPLEKQRFKEAAWDEIKRIIREEEAPRPSTRLSSSNTLASLAAGRQIEPAKLTKLVRGELDWIVMKALEKDRLRRYETANGFAMDVQRYLAGESVLAVPPSAGYRLRKFARKHRAGLTTAAAIVLLLLMGVTVSSWQAVRATRAETQARAAGDEATKERDRARTEKENTQATLDFVWQDVLFQASPWMVADRKLTLRTMIDRAAARLEAGTGRPPLVEATLRRRFGAIYTEMGEPDKGLGFLQKALDVQSRELPEDDPELLDTNYFYGRCLCILGRYDEAAAVLGRNVELRRQVKGIDNYETLIVMRWAAVSISAQGRYSEGERLFREGLDALSRMPKHQAVGQVLYRHYLAMSLAARGDLQAAEAELKRCLDDARQPGVPDDFPSVIGAQRNLAWVYVLQDDLARAEPLAVEALPRMRTVMGAQHPYTLISLWVLARVYLGQGRYDEAGPLIAEALEGSRGNQEEGIPRRAYVLGMRGQLLLAQKKYDEAEPPLRECLALWEKRLPHGGFYFLALSKRSVARECAFAKCLLGASLLGQKKYDMAKKLLVEGYDGLKAQPEFPEDATPYAQRSRVEAMTWLVQLYDEWDKPDEAAKWRKELEALRPSQKQSTR